MSRRIGTRIPTETPPDPSLFGPDLGEDWVVPRERLRYLVVTDSDDGALMTAYDPSGRIVGERFASSFDELRTVLLEAAERGAAEAIRTIPDDARSALSWLDGHG